MITIKHMSQNSQYPGQNLNQLTPEYKTKCYHLANVLSV